MLPISPGALMALSPVCTCLSCPAHPAPGYPLAGASPADAGPGVFGQARERFEEVVSWLEGPEAAGLEHGEVEDCLDARGRAVLRELYQAHLDLRAAREPRHGAVAGAD